MKHLMFIIVIIAICLPLCWQLVTTSSSSSCESSIYCQGPILDLIQRSRIFNDSKTFVDMSQKAPTKVIEERFNAFVNITHKHPNKKQILQFIDQNFEEDAELETWILSDFKKYPKLLDTIENPAVRCFAEDLIKIWPKLARKAKSAVAMHEAKYSFIPIPNGFIVPGGRFKELYYWDSYWIVKGLLLSDMASTAKGILDNFFHLIEKFGFVPNGSRVYYLNRSQPPLLSLMVGLYIDVTNDLSWLKDNIDTLAKELNWWLQKRTITIARNGEIHILAHYASDSLTPRPESYYEDYNTCMIYKDNVEKENCYRNLKSAAESGWDFSSRWIVDEDVRVKSNISRVSPLRLVPVDLNAYLCRAFNEVARFYNLLGDDENHMRWKELACSWQRSINRILYHDEDGIWYDYDVILGQPRRYFFPSNFAPLWTESYEVELQDYYGVRAAEYFEMQNITRFKGGIPTSLTKSGQQWDLPNAFPPLQEIVILGLKRTKNLKAENIARTFARRWINSMMTGYNAVNVMFEKYSSEQPGRNGGGGEYIVQVGFGWTNGVALSLINEYFSLNITRLGELCRF